MADDRLKKNLLLLPSGYTDDEELWLWAASINKSDFKTVH